MALNVSIVINNFNYARFLADAIESALAQQYSPVDVVVVDDDSSDDSQEVIDAYATRIRAIRHARNLGQAAAINSGFSASRGDLVIFLDADDVLMPDAAATVAAEFDRCPAVARVQYRLGLLDENGERLRGSVPPASLPLSSGDLRRHVLRFPDDIRSPPMSGNAFARWALDRILPAPSEDYGTLLADLYLLTLTPLYGRVVALDVILGHYRLHDRNLHHREGVDLRTIRALITRNQASHRRLRGHAARLGMWPDADDGRGQLSVTDLANRLVSLRLCPGRHPLAGDRRWRLAASGVQAASRRFDETRRRRTLFAGWFVVTSLAPQRVVRPLAERALYRSG
jgi:glycosyltransferase involved in cell wall biosynthesis